MVVKHIQAAVFLLLALVLAGARPLSAGQGETTTRCSRSPFSGSWIATDPNTDFLSKLKITDECIEILEDPYVAESPWTGALGEDRNKFYRRFTVRPVSNCSPVDCAWGRAAGQIDDKGRLKAGFKMFWSRRYLVISRENNTLLVRWRIEYMGRKKPDQLGETRLVPAG